MNTNALPKLYTAEDKTAEDVERWKNGSDRDRALIMLSAFSSQTRLPISDDHGQIASDAISEFRSADYSGAVGAVESLEMIADHYKELAQKYLEELTDLGAVVDQYGDVTTEPFVITEKGEQVIGGIEVFDIDEVGRDDGTWYYYIKPYLPHASKSELEWIAKNFPEQVSALITSETEED